MCTTARCENPKNDNRNTVSFRKTMMMTSQHIYTIRRVRIFHVIDNQQLYPD